MLAIWDELRPAIPDRRIWDRLRRLFFGELMVSGRHTITGMMEAAGSTADNCSADYRAFSRGLWDHRDLFSCLLEPILALDPIQQPHPVVASLDDTHGKKTGIRIPGVSYVRDPMSPKFRPNLIRAQRFVQVSLAIPFAPGASACRAFPVAFDHAPAAKKPKASASEADQKAFRAEREQKRLSRYGLKAIERLRSDLDGVGESERDLLVAVDASYTCQQILKNLPGRTDLIGRIRKDAVLCHLPQPVSAARGRKRWYGEQAPTPEQLRVGENTPWQSVRVFAAGSAHDCKVKELAPVLWRKAGPSRTLRMIVIAPLGYRLRKHGRILYRDPAYLITTDLTSSLEDLVQAYFRRWEIEVNHRDEKQLMGLGQAQVRAPRSVDRVPAFVVASYSILLLAAARAFGVDAAEPLSDPPSWYPQALKQIRIPTMQLLSTLRRSFLASALTALPNFSHFPHHLAPTTKCQKGTVSDAETTQFAVN